VGEPHLADAEAAAFVEVFADDGQDVRGREGMQVELAGDGEDDRRLVAGVAFAQRVILTSKEPELSVNESSLTPR
jgi:hypothetical protein